MVHKQSFRILMAFLLILGSLSLGIHLAAPEAYAATTNTVNINVADNFDGAGGNTGFTGNDGFENWIGDWSEIGESDGAGSGDVQVQDSNSGRLYIRAGDNGASRAADLSGVFNATLILEYRISTGNPLEADNYVLIQAYNAGTSTWDELGRITGDGVGSSSYTRLTFDISSYATANTRIRVLGDSSMSTSDVIYFRYFAIQYPTTESGVYCYLVADSSGGNGGNDWLTLIRKTDGVESAIGTGAGTDTIEAIAYWPDSGVLYAADANELGTLDLDSGEYTTIGSFGTGDGALGSITFSDVDSLSFDPFTGILYGAHRRGGSSEDILFQIDPGSGSYMADAFGAGVDYVVIDTSGDPDTNNDGLHDIDDIAISSADGTIYAIANNGGSGDRMVTIDKTTGAVANIGVLGVNDMEGFVFDTAGNLVGASGTGDGNGEGLYDISISTGAASNRRALDIGSDYESVACLIAGTNTIEGTVFDDTNEDGALDSGEPGISGVTVYLYRDENGDGLVDAGDTLVATLDTDGNGQYSFTVAAEGNFVLDIDTDDLPPNSDLTTDNLEAASFANYGNTDSNNDFGRRDSPTAVELASFTASGQGNAIVLTWETATELDNLGFNLYRAKAADADGGRVQLNASLIPAQAPGSPVSAQVQPLRRLLPLRPRLAPILPAIRH